MQPPRDTGRRLAALALVVTATVAVAARFVLNRAPGTAAALDGFPLDDAWIHLVYARAVSVGHGFAYNPGEPEAGFTSPLWVLLLALVFWLKAAFASTSVVLVVKALGVALGAVTALFAGCLARRLVGGLAGLTATALVVLDPSLGFARVSGMEVSLATTLALGACLAVEAKRPVVCAALVGLAVVTRPEFAMLGVALGPAVALQLWASRSVWRAACAATLGAAPALAWGAYCARVTGHPLPTTFYAKHAASAPGEAVAEVMRVGEWFVDQVPLIALGLGLIPVVAGAVRALGGASSREDYAARAGIVAWPMLFLIGCLWAHALPEPGAFYWGRYLMPALPGLAVLAGCGAALLGRRDEGVSSSAKGARRALRVGVGVALTVALGTSLWGLRERAALYAWNSQNINEVQVALGRWVALHAPRRAIVATTDAGAIRYFGHRRTIDLIGLNSHRALRDGPDPTLRRERPDVLIGFPHLLRQLHLGPEYHLVHEATARHFTICRGDQSQMVVYTQSEPSPTR